AVGFVRVRHGDTGFVCITDGIEVPRKLASGPRAPRPQEQFAGYVNPDTGQPFAGRDDVLAAWRATLDTLGERFRAGRAAVDPKAPAQTCTYCELSALCRINPQWQRPQDGAEEGDGDQT